MKQQKKIYRIYLAADFKSANHICSIEVSHRILNVLRIKNNETLCVFNHKRQEYLATISIDGKHVVLNLKEEITNKDDKSKMITLGVSIVNMKLMDLIIQKSVELGVASFCPVYTQRSQYKSVDKKLDHWKKIVIHSTEQCGRVELMKILNPVSLRDFNNNYQCRGKYLLHQGGEKFNPEDLKYNDISLLVGPEGGFEDVEIEYLQTNGWKMKTINVNILRTETACISALTLFNNYDILSRYSL